jgi:hypothetical protein
VVLVPVLVLVAKEEVREGELSRAHDGLRKLGEIHLGIPADGNTDEE